MIGLLWGPHSKKRKTGILHIVSKIRDNRETIKYLELTRKIPVLMAADICFAAKDPHLLQRELDKLEKLKRKDPQKYEEVQKHLAEMNEDWNSCIDKIVKATNYAYDMTHKRKQW